MDTAIVCLLKLWGKIFLFFYFGLRVNLPTTQITSQFFFFYFMFSHTLTLQDLRQFCIRNPDDFILHWDNLTTKFLIPISRLPWNDAVVCISVHSSNGVSPKQAHGLPSTGGMGEFIVHHRPLPQPPPDLYMTHPGSLYLRRFPISAQIILCIPQAHWDALFSPRPTMPHSVLLFSFQTHSDFLCLQQASV